MDKVYIITWENRNELERLEDYGITAGYTTEKAAERRLEEEEKKIPGLNFYIESCEVRDD